MVNYMNTYACKNDEVHCFAHNGKGCTALTDTDFGDRPCPFYKTKEQRAKELEESKRRRADGR